jgi:hypothetical protein
MANYVVYTGAVFEDIEFPMEKSYVYIIQDKGFRDLVCGNRVDFIFHELNQLTDYDIIIIDFTGIENMSEVFCKKYLRYKLSSTYKIFEINQSVSVSKVFSEQILRNL